MVLYTYHENIQHSLIPVVTTCLNLHVFTFTQATNTFSLEESSECAVINPHESLPYVSVHSTCYTVIKTILQGRGMQVDTLSLSLDKYINNTSMHMCMSTCSRHVIFHRVHIHAWPENCCGLLADALFRPTRAKLPCVCVCVCVRACVQCVCACVCVWCVCACNVCVCVCVVCVRMCVCVCGFIPVLQVWFF